jgi:hypothetical protein
MSQPAPTDPLFRWELTSDPIVKGQGNDKLSVELISFVQFSYHSADRHRSRLKSISANGTVKLAMQSYADGAAGSPCRRSGALPKWDVLQTVVFARSNVFARSDD